VSIKGDALKEFIKEKLERLLPKDLKQYATLLTKRLSVMLISFNDPQLKDWYLDQVNKYRAFEKETRNFVEELTKLRAAMYGNTTGQLYPNVTYSAQYIVSLITRGKFYQAYEALFKPNQTRIELNIEKGEFHAVAYVSPHFKNVAQRLRSSYSYLPRQLFRAANENNRMVARLYHRLDYLSQRYSNYDDMLKYLPPYSKSAWIMQNLQYVSFDGVAGYLEKQCEVTLIKDTRGNRFTITFLPSTPTTATMKITVAGKTFQLNLNGMFTGPMGSAEALPYRDPIIFARREGQLIRLFLVGGLEVELHTASHMWHIMAPSKLYGHLNGLLGSNNFHRHDDYQLASGIISKVNNALRLKSWAVGTCTAQTSEPEFPKTLTYNTSSDTVCKHLFDSSASHLSRCQFAVDPTPYSQLCRYPADKNSLGYRHVCNVERSYVAACLGGSVSARVRKECVLCGDDSKEGDRVNTIKLNPENDRFIFVIEDANCLLNKKEFVTKLADALSSENAKASFVLTQFSDNSFHTITMADGALNGTVAAFKAALKRISTMATGDASAKTMQVLYEAMDMATPPGYRDQILLFGCSSCSYDDQNSYTKLYNGLMTHGIAFHYFTKSNFTSSKVVGMDEKSVYRLVADGSVVEQTRDSDVRPTRDACGPLALQSRGSIWSIEDSAALQRALTQINRRVKWANPLTGNGQSCTCRSDKFGNGEVECRHPFNK
jgi:hypothetical protein